MRGLCTDGGACGKWAVRALRKTALLSDLWAFRPRGGGRGFGLAAHAIAPGPCGCEILGPVRRRFWEAVWPGLIFL